MDFVVGTLLVQHHAHQPQQLLRMYGEQGSLYLPDVEASLADDLANACALTLLLTLL